MELPFEELENDLLMIQRFKLNKYIQENIDYIINHTSNVQTLLVLFTAKGSRGFLVT